MLALLFGQWHFSQAHIITWHSLTLSALILSESYLSWGGRRLRHVVTQKHYINSRLTQALSRQPVDLLWWENMLLTRKQRGTLWLWMMADTSELAAPEDKQLPTEETCTGVSYTPRGADKHEDVSETVRQSMLLHEHPDGRDEEHEADAQTATAGADRKTSVPREVELAVRDDSDDCSGSVGSLCSDRSRRECPICSELFDLDRGVTSLSCNHTLCHHCVAGIMRQAKDPGCLQCPFCRQTTPFTQLEIKRLQEEWCSRGWTSAIIIGPDPDHQVGPRSLLYRLFKCCSHPPYLMKGLRVFLLLVLLGCLLYMVVPLVVLALS